MQQLPAASCREPLSLQVLVEQLRQKCLEEKVDKNGEISKAYSALTQAPQEWAVEVSNCAVQLCAQHATQCVVSLWVKSGPGRQ